MTSARHGTGLVPIAALAFAALVVAPGCTGAGKREAAALSGAVDAYRRAPPGATRAERGRAVGDVACSAPRVCEARAACVAAIDPTLRALSLKEEVASRLADVEKGALARDAPEAAALPGKLDEAERLLVEGRAKLAVCDDRLRDLDVDLGR